MLSSPELAHEYKNNAVEAKIIKQVYSELLEGTEQCLSLRYHVDLSFINMLSEKYPACEFEQSFDGNWIYVRLKPCPITEKKKLPVQISKEPIVQEKEQSNQVSNSFSFVDPSGKSNSFSFGAGNATASTSVFGPRPVNATTSTFLFGSRPVNANSTSVYRNPSPDGFGSFTAPVKDFPIQEKKEQPNSFSFGATSSGVGLVNANSTSRFGGYPENATPPVAVPRPVKNTTFTAPVNANSTSRFESYPENATSPVTVFRPVTAIFGAHVKDIPIQEKKEQSNEVATNSRIGNEDVIVVNTQ